MTTQPPSLSERITVVEFEDRHAAAFRDLNAAWIEEHFRLEPKDLETLGDPRGSILAKGGTILIAEENGTPVACCALIPRGSGTLELAKMAVAAAHRGRGVGRLMMTSAVARAKALGTSRLYLESNTKLAPAIRLYESFGFKRIPESATTPSPYARANIAMDLDLTAHE